jgi:glycosyltransferase involved in cell wall biosynthesis
VTRFSVFTPSHRPQYLDECLDSLRQQTEQNWEWVVILDGTVWRPPYTDQRIRVMRAPGNVEGVGALKRLACEEARGEILVELDHDDLLVSNALEEIGTAFNNEPDVSLVYSHTAQISPDGTRDDSRFDEAHGWVYEDMTVDELEVLCFKAMNPTPHNVSYIWYAPNHVRAFRKSAYEKAGGYDADRRVLDDQDLMCRLYQVGPFKLIDKCLYLQRIHPTNTQSEPDTNAFIQEETVRLYDLYMEANCLAWAKHWGLAALDLGAAHNHPDGYLGVDKVRGPDTDIVAQLPCGLSEIPSSSVGVIRAVDFLEHVGEKVALMNEIYRLLAPGGLLLSQTPSTDGRGAFQDPTHVSFWNENSFWYYTDVNYRNFVPEITAQFQTSRLVTYFPTDWHREHDISYVAANLIALKEPMPRNGGPIFF